MFWSFVNYHKAPKHVLENMELGELYWLHN